MHMCFLAGLAQCTELCRQLRGECGKRQVSGARIALQHNLGLGGAVVVAMYRLGFPNQQRYRCRTGVFALSLKRLEQSSLSPD